MPYVYRRQQPFSPLISGNRTLIGWYDNSNVIYNGGETNSILDRSDLDNRLYLNNGQVNVNASIGKFSLENNTFYRNLLQMNARYSFKGISFFYVGAPGYSPSGFSGIELLYIDNYKILSVNSDNTISINNLNIEKLIVNGNNIMLISGSINAAGSGVLYVNNNSPISISSGVALNEVLGINFFIGSPNNTYNINTLADINSNINIYLFDRGSNIYLNSLPSVNEVLVYNSVLNPNEFQNINSYLINKWKIVSPNIESFQNISHLLCWYSITKSNTLYITTNETRQVQVIRDIGGLSNSIYSPGQPGGGLPRYFDNLIHFNNINTYYSTQLFNGSGSMNGLTVSMVLNSASYNGPKNYGVILSIYSADSNNTSFMPIIINDSLGNIAGTFIRSGTYYNIDISNNNIDISNNIMDISNNNIDTLNDNLFSLRNVGTTSSNLYILTAQFDASSTQIFINGLPMIGYSIENNWDTATNLKINYGGSMLKNSNHVCDISLGETIIYKKKLNISELETVHSYLATKYNIAYNQPTNYYLWFNNNIGQRDGPINTINVNHQSGNIILSNTSSGYPFLRSSYIDFNNGSSSFLEANDTAQILSNLNSNLYIYIISPVNNESIEERGSFLYMEATNKSYMNFEIIYNSNSPIFQITNYDSTTNNSNILSYNITNNILPTLFTIKIDNNNNAITSNISSYSIPNIASNTVITNSQNFNMHSFSNINTIRVGSNCNNRIGDIIIYNRNLYQNEEVNILAYLQNKWSIPKQLIFPTDYTFWFDPRNISNTSWTDKTGNFTLTYSDISSLPATTPPVTTIIGCNTYLSGNTEYLFYNSFVTVDGYDIPINGAYTYFIVCSSNRSTDIQNIFSMSSVSDLSTSLQCDTNNVLYPTHYTNGNITNELNRKKFRTQLQTTIDTPYIICVTYNYNDPSFNTPTYIISTKGSISENNSTDDVTGDNFLNADGIPQCTISIGGFAARGNGIIGNTFTGDIGDVIYYGRLLSDFEKLSVTQYLEAKYYSSKGEPSYINVNP